MLAKKHRLKRFHYPHSDRGLIVPIDHGLTIGPVAGVESIRAIERWVHHGSICGVIAHKGIAERLLQVGALQGRGLMIHLNGMSALSTRADDKERLTSLETAVRTGADGVSFQVNFDGTNDSHNLRTMGSVVDEAARFGLPVLAMVYDKLPSTTDATTVTRLRHLIRISIELGCDAVKVAPPARYSLVPEILAGLSDDIQIYFAGGNLGPDRELLELTRTAMRSGAAGLCVGRNVFQRDNSGELLEVLRELISPRPFSVTEVPLTLGLAYDAH